MLEMNDLRIGITFATGGEPFVVLSTQHVQMGRGSAVLRARIRHLLTGNVYDRTFKHGDRFEDVDLRRSGANFLYRDDAGFHFMDNASFEQITLPDERIGDRKHYLKEGDEYDIVAYDDKPILVEIPKKIILAITETEPGIRGDTAQGSVTKPATLETGLTVNVPLFVKTGDRIVVNTESGTYVERAK